jgi:poly(A) polymerase
VVRVLGPKGAGEVEVATFRTDGRYLDGRRPEAVTFGSPREDAARRDFTINGMFFDPINETVLDFVGGRDDLAAGLVRAIGDPSARFAEDKLRLLRAVRFAARFGFRIEAATNAALVAMAEQIHVVAAERIAQELRRMLVHVSRVRGMILTLESGLAAAILPELVPLRGLAQDDPPGTSQDVWSHTLAVLDQLPVEPSFALALAALLHDVGKPLTRTAEGAYPEHERIGAELAEGLGRDLKLANAERERVVWLVGHHHALRQPRALRRSQLKLLLVRPEIDDLLALERAHALATSGDVSHVEYCEAYRRDQPDGPLDPPPLLTGADLLALGLNPGPSFRTLLDAVREAQLEGELADRAAALRWVEERVRG